MISRLRSLPELVDRAPRLSALVAGVLEALAFPPRGWWPLGLMGIALLLVVAAGQDLRGRVRVGFAGGLGFYGGALALIWRPSVPVLVVVAELFAAAILSLLVVAVVASTPRGRWALLGFPAALVVVDAVQSRWPFEGLPLVGVALGQVDGPVAWTARLGGQAAVVATAGLVAATLAAVWLAPRRWVLPALASASAVVLLAAAFAPRGRSVGDIEATLVQGGGERGVNATPFEVTYRLHRDALRDLERGAELVVLPEGTVHMNDERAPFEIDELSAEADRLDATVVAGVVERLVERDRFLNSAYVWDGDGDLLGVYDKVHAVPFAEYIPGRSLLGGFLDLSIVPRDLLEGKELAPVDTPAGRLGVLISFEVFFPGLARDLVRDGAEVLLVPTNAGSFEDAQVPSFEVAASKLRALESGRWVLQVTPTGFSAVVDPDGDVVATTSLGSDAQIVTETVEHRRGRTPFAVAGEWPVILLAALALAGAWAPRLRARLAERGEGEPTGRSGTTTA